MGVQEKGRGGPQEPPPHISSTRVPTLWRVPRQLPVLLPFGRQHSSGVATPALLSLLWKTYPRYLWKNNALMSVMETLWKMYPQRLWENGWLKGGFVDGVENLSTGIVEN